MFNNFSNVGHNIMKPTQWPTLLLEGFSIVPRAGARVAIVWEISLSQTKQTNFIHR